MIIATASKFRAFSATLMGAASAACIAVSLVGCAGPTPLPPVVVPPHAEAPPPVSLSSHVVEAASEYHLYMRRAAAITPSFVNGPQIEESLNAGEEYETAQLARGMIAYGALIALQDPGFVASVRTYAVDPTGRRALAARIVADPGYVAALPNAASAAGLVITTLNADGSKVKGAGELVKQFAYDVQHQAWSKKDIINPAGRLAKAKEVSNAPMTPVPADVEQLQTAVAGGDLKATKTLTVSGEASAPPYTPLVNRALAIAALAALGEGGDQNDAQVESLLNESSGGFCLTMSKLNLYQCLAVAKPWYEDVFCLGQHVLIDTGQCVAKQTGKLQPVQVAATPASGSVTPAPGAAQ